MNGVKRFFLFCSGIDLEILQKCPTDRNKYIGIGATVFFTGVLALISSAYALFTVFDNTWIALGFGLIWGLMIFNLDRYIVSSMKSKGSFGRDFLVALPRLGLAILLALVISKPLELKIFDKEINAELLIMEQEVFKGQEDTIKARYVNSITDYESQVNQLKAEIKAKTEHRDALLLIAQQEADGTGGSMQRNLGPIYKAKKADADKAQAELEALITLSQPKIDLYESEIALAKTSINQDIAGLDRTTYGGIAARMDALHRLTQKSEAIFWTNLFIVLLFIAIETAPILVKLISYRSPYDYLLDEEEHQYKMNHLEKTGKLSVQKNNSIKHEEEVIVYATKANIESDKELIDHALKEKLAAIKHEGRSWEELLGRFGI
jgi:hypothetical protein